MVDLQHFLKEQFVEDGHNDRFQARVDDDVMRKMHVMCIGCGALGSYILMLLAKLGVGRFTLYDPDIFEAPNVGVQAFGMYAIGQHKVRIARELIEEHGRLSVQVAAFHCHFRRYTQSKQADFVILALDSLRARLDCVHNIRGKRLGFTNGNERFGYVLDPRMDIDKAELWVMPYSRQNPLYDSRWEQQYVNVLDNATKDNHAPRMQCGLHGLPTTSMMGAVLTVQTLLDIAANKRVARYFEMDINTLQVTRGTLLCEKSSASARLEKALAKVQEMREKREAR